MTMRLWTPVAPLLKMEELPVWQPRRDRKLHELQVMVLLGAMFVSVVAPVTKMPAWRHNVVPMRVLALLLTDDELLVWDRREQQGQARELARIHPRAVYASGNHEK